MKKVLALSFMLFMASCQSDSVDLVTDVSKVNQELRILNPFELSRDVRFAKYADSFISLALAYSSQLESYKENERESFHKRNLGLLNSQTLAKKELQVVVFGGKNASLCSEYLANLEESKRQLTIAYPDLINNKDNIFEKAFEIYIQRNPIVSFIKDSKGLKVAGGNCRGIYNACLGVAAAAGTACIVGTAGIGIYACVLVAGAGMEYCRQEYIGCNAEK
ncbi:hypothetical protein MCERE19_02472 [Spirosomataceae bacterium]|jgi:hypothetical protein